MSTLLLWQIILAGAPWDTAIRQDAPALISTILDY